MIVNSLIVLILLIKQNTGHILVFSFSLTLQRMHSSLAVNLDFHQKHMLYFQCCSSFYFSSVHPVKRKVLVFANQNACTCRLDTAVFIVKQIFYTITAASYTPAKALPPYQ